MLTLTALLCGFGLSSLWFQDGKDCAAAGGPPSIITGALNTAATTTTTTPPVLSDNITCSVSPQTHLRILPLGDSITVGWGGSQYWNSYRKDLLSFLDEDCPMRNVTYVGSQQTGNFAYNQHEGHAGYAIESIANDTQPGLTTSLLQQPNVVLLLAGTNDLSDLYHLPYSEAPERLGKLMDQVLEAVENVTLIVAQVPMAHEKEDGRGSRVPAFNAAIPGVVAARVTRGYKVHTVDLSSIGVDDVDLRDHLHPNDEGYRTMAVLWFRALQVATLAELISPPNDVASTA